MLMLKRASASRPSGEWNDDDYDVLAESIVVGRIMKAAATPVGQPWLWTLAFEHHEDCATGRRARAQWPPSPRAGSENKISPYGGQARRSRVLKMRPTTNHAQSLWNITAGCLTYR